VHPAVANPLTAKEHPSLRHNLRASMIDGTFYSVMVGVGENAIGPFLLALHPAAAVQAGLVASVPLVLGAFLQLVAPRVVAAIGSHRNAVVLFSCLQALAFIPLALGAFLGALPLPLIFACAAMYWGAGLGAGAAWNTWAATIVPSRIRAKYFGRRSRAIHAGVLSGLLVGGLLLQFTPKEFALSAFGSMFLLAAVARAISAYFLYSQGEPTPMPADHRRVPFRELVARLGHGPDARLLAYMIAVQMTVNLAQPFFIPYALKQVQLGYASYFLLIAGPYAARMLAFPLMGQIAHRASPRVLLWIGGIGLAPISGLWMLADSVPLLLLAQLVAGVAWAAYELGTFLLIWETVSEGERTSVMTTFNLCNSGANAGGALVGGQILSHLGKDTGAYHAVFALSLAVRVATIILLIRIQRHAMPRAVANDAASAAPPPTRPASRRAAEPGRGRAERRHLPSSRRPPGV
jgi:MFS family permease